MAHRRRVLSDEPLEALNGEPPYLPVAATWYDAKAYARWIKRTQHLPVRLPTEEEYLILAADLVPIESPVTNSGKRAESASVSSSMRRAKGSMDIRPT